MSRVSNEGAKVLETGAAPHTALFADFGNEDPRTGVLNAAYLAPLTTVKSAHKGLEEGREGRK